MMQAPLAPPGQVIAFPGPVESSSSPGVLWLAVTFRKVQRRRCTACGNRRVCFYMGIGDVVASAPLCAKCQGIR
jgi:hypothetical protein